MRDGQGCLTSLLPQMHLKPLPERCMDLPRGTFVLQELSHLVEAIPLAPVKESAGADPAAPAS